MTSVGRAGDGGPGLGCWAPSECTNTSALDEVVARIQAEPVLLAMLEAMPTLAALLNDQRQIVAANRRLCEALGADDPQMLVGKRVGDAFGCAHCPFAPSGCGSGSACGFCGAAQAMVESARLGGPVARECRMLLPLAKSAGNMELEVLASPLQLGDLPLTIITLRDMSAEKRRHVLERVFFHDMLDTAGGMRGLASLLMDGADPQQERDFKQMLLDLSSRLIDMIIDQRQLLAAESGELDTHPVLISVPTALRSVYALFVRHDAALERKLTLGPMPNVDVETDIKLLQRVLGNMVKNALEAIAPGQCVTLEAHEDGSDVVFSVNNPGAMTEQAKHQVFHRSFSTKGEGRGLGTHSMRLLGEGYLGGKVAFTSNEQDGTTFTFRVPRVWAGRQVVPAAKTALG